MSVALESAEDLPKRLGQALRLDVPSLIMLPIGYSIDVSCLRGAGEGYRSQISIVTTREAAGASTQLRGLTALAGRGSLAACSPGCTCASSSNVIRATTLR